MTTQLTVESVWKGYPRWAAGTRTLRAIATRRAPLLTRKADRRWALRDVSLEVPRGASMGVIGSNGAGKSTLLRLVAGLGRPTQGRISAPAATASVLNLGALFDPSLSGRENAMTQLIVQGWRHNAAAAAIARVIDFAELEEFADAPVRIYSDGMRLRLAFGVVAQLEPELLLVDEVLAVGDQAFQAKCVERIEDLRASGTTLLFASHDLAQVAAHCEQAVWLRGGRVHRLGDARRVIAEYQDAGRAETLARTPEAGDAGADDLHLGRDRFGSQEATIEAIRIQGAEALDRPEVDGEGLFSLSLRVRAHGKPLVDPIVQLRVFRAEDDVLCFESTTEATGLRLGHIDDSAEVEMVSSGLGLVPGEYLLDVGVYPPDWSYAYDYHWHAYRLRVVGPERQGVYRPQHRWERRSKTGERRSVAG